MDPTVLVDMSAAQARVKSDAISKFEAHLDKYLPAAGERCALGKCVPGWIWLTFAGISLVASVNSGWSTVLKTVVWEAIVGWGVAWLCRGCHTRWLWFFMIFGSMLPLAIFAIAAIAIASGGKSVDPAKPACTSGCSQQ